MYQRNEQITQVCPWMLYCINSPILALCKCYSVPPQMFRIGVVHANLSGCCAEALSPCPPNSSLLALLQQALPVTAICCGSHMWRKHTGQANSQRYVYLSSNNALDSMSAASHLVFPIQVQHFANPIRAISEALQIS